MPRTWLSTVRSDMKSRARSACCSALPRPAGDVGLPPSEQCPGPLPALPRKRGRDQTSVATRLPKRSRIAHRGSAVCQRSSPPGNFDAPSAAVADSSAIAINGARMGRGLAPACFGTVFRSTEQLRGEACLARTRLPRSPAHQATRTGQLGRRSAARFSALLCSSPLRARDRR